MRIQLDTENKIIKLEDSVLLADLVKTLNKLLPNSEWKQFVLETHTTITHWHEPYIIKTYPRKRWDYPWYDKWDNGKMLVSKKSETAELKSGVYNVQTTPTP